MNSLDINYLLIEISKYSLIIAFVIYGLFSIILIRQSYLMSKTIIAGFNKYLLVFCYVHLVAAIWFGYIIISLLF